MEACLSGVLLEFNRDGTNYWYKPLKWDMFKLLILNVLNLVACNREFESLTHRHILKGLIYQAFFHICTKVMRH